MEHTVLPFLLTLLLSSAIVAPVAWLCCCFASGISPRLWLGHIVCANRGHHRLTIAEHHWLELGDEVPGTFLELNGRSLALREMIEHTERRPFCTTCRSVVGD